MESEIRNPKCYSAKRRFAAKHESEIRNFTGGTPVLLRTAFTLIELLTVIVIIILLTGILLPTIVKAKQLAYIATTKAYITQLETGALRYQQENQYFPGQDGVNAVGYTGSQILISELMGIERTGTGGGFVTTTPPTSPYVEYKEDRVIHTAVDTPENPHDYPLCTPVDLFPTSDAYALLYYPSVLGNDGRVGTALSTGNNQGAFRFADNEEYTDTLSAFRVIIWDKRFGVSDADADEPDANEAIDKAYNADTFLIFGKGINDRDEAYSWFTPNSPKNF